MERLSALDAEFLYLEDDVSHMHIAGACVFDGPAPPLSDIKGLVASKLHLIPRYRQRIRSVPLDLGRPVWVDDRSSISTATFGPPHCVHQAMTRRSAV